MLTCNVMHLQGCRWRKYKVTIHLQTMKTEWVNFKVDTWVENWEPALFRRLYQPPIRELWNQFRGDLQGEFQVSGPGPSAKANLCENEKHTETKFYVRSKLNFEPILKKKSFGTS